MEESAFDPRSESYLAYRRELSEARAQGDQERIAIIEKLMPFIELDNYGTCRFTNWKTQAAIQTNRTGNKGKWFLACEDEVGLPTGVFCKDLVDVYYTHCRLLLDGRETDIARISRKIG